jgi:hypothetical protein
MENSKDVLYTVGTYSKEYRRRFKTDLSITQINGFLKDVYDELLDKMILEEYKLVIGRIYEVSFKKKERNFDKLVVNFGASNKIKAEILARGGKLATRIGTSPNGNPVFDDGELWMVFHTDAYYATMNFMPIKINVDGKMTFYGQRFIWTLKQNTKALKRLNNYERQGLINKNNIPLHYGSKNNII